MRQILIFTFCSRPQRPAIEPDSPNRSIQMTSFSPQVQGNDPLLSGHSPRGKVINFKINIKICVISTGTNYLSEIPLFFNNFLLRIE